MLKMITFISTLFCPCKPRMNHIGISKSDGIISPQIANGVLDSIPSQYKERDYLWKKTPCFLTMFCFVFSILLVGALALLGRVEAKYPLPGVQTGVDPQTGARPARRNIVDLQNDVPAW